MGRRTLLQRSGIAEVVAAERVLARGFYHLTIGQKITDDQPAAAQAVVGGPTVVPDASDGNGRKHGSGYLEIWHGALPIEPMCAGDIVLRLEGGHKLTAKVELYVPETRVADFTCIDTSELDRLVPSRRS